MAYLGSKPSSGFITTAKQRITSSTNNYVDLDHSISSLADVILWVNFVKQDSTNLSLTTSTRITLGGTLVASDIVEIAYLGKAVATQTPDTGTVTNDMLAGSIANSKLANSSITLNGSAVSLGGSATTPSGAMTLIARASSSGAVGDIAVDNCFSDTYDYYKIYFWINAEDDEGELRFRWRKSGSDRTDSYYINTGYASQKSSSASSSYTAFQQWNSDHFVFLNNLNENDNMGTTVELTIYDPRARDEGNLATLQYHGSTFRDDSLWVNINGGGFYGNQGSGDDFDGFKLYIDNSNIKYYDYAIYGFNKT